MTDFFFKLLLFNGVSFNPDKITFMFNMPISIDQKQWKNTAIINCFLLFIGCHSQSGGDDASDSWESMKEASKTLFFLTDFTST